MDYYSKLGLKRDASTQDVWYSYKKLILSENEIGNSDFDNMRALITNKELLEATNVLCDRTRRFRYDIRYFGSFEYLDKDFESKEALHSFIDVIKEELSQFNNELNRKNKEIGSLNSRINSLTGQILENQTDSSIKLEIEKNRGHDLEKVINNLLIQIDSLKTDVNVLKDIESKVNDTERNKRVIEKHNNQLLKIARNNRNNIFKIVTVVISFFIFIILILCLNL